MKKIILICIAMGFLTGCGGSDSTSASPSPSITINKDPDPAIDNGLFTVNLTGTAETYDFEIFFSVDDQLSGSDIAFAFGGCELIPACTDNLFVADLYWRNDMTMSVNTTNEGTNLSTLVTAIPYDGYIIVEFCAFANPNDCQTAAAPITLY